ncbi:34084_t:CDS:2, partial [Gigaspora margarita]
MNNVLIDGRRTKRKGQDIMVNDTPVDKHDLVFDHVDNYENEKQRANKDDKVDNYENERQRFNKSDNYKNERQRFNKGDKEKPSVRKHGDGMLRRDSDYYERSALQKRPHIVPLVGFRSEAGMLFADKTIYFKKPEEKAQNENFEISNVVATLDVENLVQHNLLQEVNEEDMGNPNYQILYHYYFTKYEESLSFCSYNPEYQRIAKRVLGDNKYCYCNVGVDENLLAATHCNCDRCEDGCKCLRSIGIHVKLCFYDLFKTLRFTMHVFITSLLRALRAFFALFLNKVMPST